MTELVEKIINSIEAYDTSFNKKDITFELFENYELKVSKEFVTLLEKQIRIDEEVVSFNRGYFRLTEIIKIIENIITS